MASEEDIGKVITQFQQNFPMDGFLAFDSGAAINFMGNILVNYKGLRLIKFRKAQLMMGQFSNEQFENTCNQVLKGQKGEEREQLFGVLKEKYPNCAICVISGGISKATGNLAQVKKGQTTALIY